MTTGRAGVFPVSTAGIVVDVSDRDARLLGRVKLLNAAGVLINPANEHVLANDPASVRLTDGAAFYDARQIRNLVFPGDSVGVSQNGPFVVTGPAAEGAALSGSPVRIAGGDLAGLVRTLRVLADGTAKAREDALPMTWVSAVVTAPAANVVIADTGALAAGDYDFDVTLCVADTTLAAGKCLLLEHRNAANGATLQTLAVCAQQGNVEMWFRRYTLALNERLRVINGAVAGLAASRYQGAIGRRLS